MWKELTIIYIIKKIHVILDARKANLDGKHGKWDEALLCFQWLYNAVCDLKKTQIVPQILFFITWKIKTRRRRDPEDDDDDDDA